MTFLKKENLNFYSSDVLKSYNLNDSMRYQLSLLDSLDVYTRKHSENVANITCRLCNYLHMSEGFTIYATTCAYLHDIGKLYIPPEILQKTTKLTDEEYEIMKKHTVIGNKICSSDPKLRPYATGAYYHHEYLNGSGYPQGLKGKDIPYEAKIITVADIFDAIRSKRQYKSHIGITEVLRIMQEERKSRKIDKGIFKQLIKIVKEDTEYEIINKVEYINYLNDEVKRFKLATKYYNKMIKEKKEEKKEYYRLYTRGYLKHEEKEEDVPQYLKDVLMALAIREKEYEKLNKELKIIKRFKP